MEHKIHILSTSKRYGRRKELDLKKTWTSEDLEVQKAWLSGDLDVQGPECLKDLDVLGPGCPGTWMSGT